MLLKKDKIMIICEASQTYEGSFEVAEKLVKLAIEVRADAIKFQIFKTEELATSNYQHYKLFKKLELEPAQWKKLIDLAHQGGILFLADVFGIDSAKILVKLGIDGFKIHATDIKNIPLLEFLARTKKSLILSVSGSHKDEIEKAINILKKGGAKEIILHHGFQSYPTLVEDTNLNKIKLLQNEFGLPVGFADHIAGDHELKFDLCFIALGLGAKIIEKHITLDRALKMEDYESALDPSVFKQFVSQLRELEKSLGKETFNLSLAEEKYRLATKKHIVATCDLKSGSKINFHHLAMKRTGKNYQFQNIEEIVGKELIKSVKKDEIIKLENLK